MRTLVCPVVVGRDGELAVVDLALADAVGGKGTPVFILGEAGIGKTRLVDEARLRADALGLRVLYGRAVESGSQVPFRPFAEAFQSAFRDQEGPPDEVAAFRPILGKLVPQWATDKHLPETNPVLLFEGVVRLVELASKRSGAVLILEDLHWADAETLSVLEYLADHISSRRVACLATARIDEPLESVAAITRIASRFPGSRLVLERLTRPFVDEMAKQMIGDARSTAPLVSAVTARSEGVPLLVEELLSSFVESTEASGRERPTEIQGLPPSYMAVVAQRVALLNEEERNVLLVAAALGFDVDADLITGVTGLSGKRVNDALRSARRANLLTERVEASNARLVFRHAAVADALLAQLLPEERRALYDEVASRVVDLFPGLPGEWCNRVADMRVKAGQQEQASLLLVEIGRRTLQRGALLTSQQALERARALVEGDRWKTTGVDRLLVRVLSLLGDTRRLVDLADSAMSFMEEMPDLLGTAERQGEVLLQIARGIASSRDWQSVRSHLQPVLQLAENSSSEEFRARVRAFEARVALELGDLEMAQVASAEALPEGHRLGVDEALLESQKVKAGLAIVSGDLSGATEMLEDAKLHAERRDLPLWRVDLLLDLAAIEETSKGSVDNILSARALVGKTEAPLAEARVELQLARVHLARFELDLADEALRRALEMCRRYRLPLLREGLSVRAQAAALQGDARLVREATVEAEDLTPTAVDRIGFCEANVILKLVRADLSGAAAAIGSNLGAISSDRFERHRWVSGLSLLMNALDHSDRKPAWLPTHPFTRLAEAIALGRAGDRVSAELIFEDADGAVRETPWRRNVARRLVAEAALQDRWGNPSEWLSEASSFLTSAGHAPIASSCNGLLRRAGITVSRRGRGSSVVPKGLASLGITSREMDVLDLVGEGLSNKDIAERLFLSVRTVESHVGSAMRKTGVETRSQLIAKLLGEREAT